MGREGHAPRRGRFLVATSGTFLLPNSPNLVSLCPCASLSLFLSPFLSLSGSPPPLRPCPPGRSVTPRSRLPVPTPRAVRWGLPGRMPRSNLHLDPWPLRVRTSFLVTAEPRDPQLPAIPTPSPALPGHWGDLRPPPTASKLSLCAPCMKFHCYGLPCIGAVTGVGDRLTLGQAGDPGVQGAGRPAQWGQRGSQVVAEEQAVPTHPDGEHRAAEHRGQGCRLPALHPQPTGTRWSAPSLRLSVCLSVRQQMGTGRWARHQGHGGAPDFEALLLNDQ